MKGLKGDRNPAWKGGRTTRSGYILVRVDGKYVQEHILIAEKALGRKLSRKHPVHHHDENRTNNANSNLVICQSRGYHNLLHARMNCIRDGVNPNSEKRCMSCQTVKPLTSFHKGKSSNGKMSRCKECWAQEQRQRKRKLISVVCRKCGRTRSIQSGSPRKEYCHSCSLKNGRQVPNTSDSFHQISEPNLF